MALSQERVGRIVVLLDRRMTNDRAIFAKPFGGQRAHDLFRKLACPGNAPAPHQFPHMSFRTIATTAHVLGRF